ncbi:MAG: hypothetical protein K0M70_13680 [Arenimonas sp.]|uniref:hypothetical protein n=1 Tax=Arenimonas sp. TaxID=1872635 RepID=UPI0025BCD87C|nr:hypothetical protein [Arenimonas sp.]MBW8368895.1 hypothetical protein [Arenimonas sp.]
MSTMDSNQDSKSFRWWSAPLLLMGAGLLTGAVGTGSTHHLLLGSGALLGGVFAFRHNLMDLSPKGLDPNEVGVGWLALLAASGLLVLAAAIVSFGA